jgi:predicted nucleic acid-binding protein
VRGASGSDLLLDTDICIDHLRGARRLTTTTEDASYSVITRCELYAGYETDEARVEALLGPLNEIPVERAVAIRAGRLRRSVALRTPDAIIAATAIEHGLQLVTRNIRDFGAIRGLRIRDPEDIS